MVEHGDRIGVAMGLRQISKSKTTLGQQRTEICCCIHGSVRVVQLSRGARTRPGGPWGRDGAIAAMLNQREGGLEAYDFEAGPGLPSLAAETATANEAADSTAERAPAHWQER